MRGLVSWIRISLFATTVTPFLVINFAPFPFVFGKMIFLRSIAAIVAALAVVYFVFYLRRQDGNIFLGFLRNPLFIAVTVFMFSVIISAVFAPNGYRVFFGELDRGEGLYGLLVYFILFLVMFFFFNKEHWQLYFRLGLVVGAVVIIHVFLRYLGIAFPFALGSTRQPGSFLGNPAFVTSFLILLFAYAAFAYKEADGFWKYFAVVVGIAGLGVIGLLAVRGALVGVAAGILFFVLGIAISGRKQVKTALKAILLLIFAFGVFFWFTQGNDFWRAVPVFDRIVGFSSESASVQTRLLSWEISWRAFLERPIFGWGQENYGIAYNKYYDPAYAIYAEDWFDRAHNKILDILVMQGTAGVMSYLGIFLALFYVLWKVKEFRGIRLFFGAVTAAYFIQNLFIFDQINSYLPFFTILSFCAFWYGRERQPEEIVQVPKVGRLLLGGGAILLLLVAAYSIYAWNFVLLSQARNHDFHSYNFSQKGIRSLFFQQSLEDETLTPEILAALEEVASKEPQDARLMVRLAEGYNELGINNSEFFARGVEYVKKAQELSPKRQAIRGLYSLILSGSGRHEEAVGLARATVALEPKAAKSHYWLGMTLALSGSKNAKEEALPELNIALEGARELAAIGSYVLFFESDFRNMLIAYKNLGAKEELLETYKIATEFYPRNLDFYRIGLVAARDKRDAAEMIRAAERIYKLDPGSRDEMDVIIDLARKEKWEILDNL